MNLKKIIQSQKTQKFDLTSLVRDAEETLHESSTGSSSGAAATSSTWAKIKSLYESEEYDKLLRSKIINKDGQKVQVGTAIDYSYKSGKMTDSEKDAYRQAIAAIGDAVAKGKIEKEDIPANEREVLDQARRQSTATATEPSQGTGTDDDEESYDDKLADLFDDDDEAKKKKELEAKKRAEKEAKKKKGEEQEELSKKDKEAIRQINDSLPDSIKEADPSIARALHYGYNKVPKEPPSKAGSIWTPAPGNASSLFNETVSMVGAELLKENPNMSREELKTKLEGMFGETEAWKSMTKKPEHIDTTVDAAITKYNMTKEAMEDAGINPKEAQTKSYYGTEVSLQNQYDDIMKHEGSFYGGNGQEITSIPTDTETRMFLENFKDPKTGEKLSEQDINNMLDNPNDKEVIQRFLALSAYNGGGGGNPSDTATIITEDDKMQFIAFSDKTSLGDQQANSTPNQLINNFFGTIRILKGDGYEIDPKDEEKMKSVIEEKGNKFKEAERNVAKAQSAPFNVLSKLLSDKNNKKAKDIFDEAHNIKPPKKKEESERYKPINNVFTALTDPTVKGKDKETKKPYTQEDIIKKNLNDPAGCGVTENQRKAMEEAGVEPPTWSNYLQQVGWNGEDDITPELVEAAYIARAGDSREFTDPKTGQPTSVGNSLTPSKQQRYIADAVKLLRKSAASEGGIEMTDDDRNAVVNQQRQIAKYREESVDALHELHDELNKITVRKDGQESEMGDALMAMDMVRSLHLGMIDEEDAPGLFNSGSVHIVAGKHSTSPKAMKECLNEEGAEGDSEINTIDDLVRNTRTRPPEQSGPQTPSGLYESELSRSTKEKATNDKGENLYIVDGKYKFSADKPEGDDVQGPLGEITGRKVFAYVLDAKGNEIPVGEMSMRTKGGTTLQTTYTFSKGLKECLERKSAPTNESFNALLGNILDEEKINTLAHHWKIAEDDYPVDLFIKELNERSLN